MTKPGPVGAPTALRLLRGDKPCRINQNEPVVRDAIPEAPASLSAEVRAIWDYTLDELIAMKTAAAADRDSLICYCEAVVSHRKACAVLAKSPILLEGIHGTLVRNPALQIQRDSAQTIRGFAQEFGLTPSARTGIQMEGRTGGNQNSNPFTAIG